MSSSKLSLLALLALVLLIVAAWAGSAWLARPTTPEVAGRADPPVEVEPGPPAVDPDVAPPARREPAARGEPAPTDAPPAEDAGEEPPPSRDLRVLLVDPDGEPLPDAPVHLVTELPFAPGRLDDDHAGDTGVTGIAVLEGSARLLDLRFHAPEEAGPYRPSRLGVRCGLSPGDEKRGFDESWVVWLEDEPAPGELVRVESPPLGWIDVEVAPDPVAAARSSAPFWAAWIRMEGDRRTGTRGGRPFEPGARTDRIGPFGAGWTIDVTLSRVGRVDPLGYERVVLPATHGEVVRLTFDEPPSTWVEGVALHPSGEPFAGEQLRAYLGDPDAGARGGVRVVPDAEGRWSFGAPRDAQAELLVLVASGPMPAPRGDAALSLPAASAEVVDVGEVVIRSRANSDRLLASGRIRAEDGTPLRGAWVTAYVVAADGVEGQPAARTRTDSRGDYELVASGELAGSDVEVYAWHVEYLRPDPLRVPVGSRAVDLTLRPGGAVTGEILVDPGVNPEQVVIRLEGPNRERTLSLAEFQFQEKGAFQGLPPGTWELRFEIRKTDWVLLEARGEILDVERLDLGPFDLRGTVRALELRLADAAGEPIADERFELVDRDRVGYRSLESGPDGRIRCLVPAEATTFLFGSVKYGAHTIAAGPDPIELTLSE